MAVGVYSRGVEGKRRQISKSAIETDAYKYRMSFRLLSGEETLTSGVIRLQGEAGSDC